MCIALVILKRCFPLETDKAIPERAFPPPEKVSSFDPYEREVFVQNEKRLISFQTREGIKISVLS
jgi:hypothetical protein